MFAPRSGPVACNPCAEKSRCARAIFCSARHQCGRVSQGGGRTRGLRCRQRSACHYIYIYIYIFGGGGGVEAIFSIIIESRWEEIYRIHRCVFCEGIPCW